MRIGLSPRQARGFASAVLIAATPPLFVSGAAFAAPQDRFYERSFVLAANDRCGLFEPQLTAAQRAGLQKLIDGATPRNDETALDSRGWQESMFSERASHLLETAAMRLRKAGKSDGFAVFNAAQDHILAAAKAEIRGGATRLSFRTSHFTPSPHACPMVISRAKTTTAMSRICG